MINLIKNICGYFKYRRELKNSIYADNLYSEVWLVENHPNLMNALPETWTHIDNFNFVKFGIQMAILSVHWDDKEDLEGILSYLEIIGMLKRKNGYQIIRNSDTPFGDAYKNINY